MLNTVNQISTLFDLGTTDGSSENEKKKKKKFPIYCETKLRLSYIRIFGTSIWEIFWKYVSWY